MSSPQLRLNFALSRSTVGGQGLNRGNEMISQNDRLHYMVKNQLTQHLRRLALLEVHRTTGKLHKQTPMFDETQPCSIIVRIAPPSKRKMDVPNWYPTIKAIIDGMTDAGVFSDDNNNVITFMGFIAEPKTNDKKYHITLDVHQGAIVL